MSSNFLQDLITKTIKAEATKAISKQLNVSESDTANSIPVALELLMGGLAKNSEDKTKAKSLAKALDKDHDGSLLNDVLGQLNNKNNEVDGQKIIEHIFGEKTNIPAEAIEKAANIKPGQGKQILAILAPVLMESLGKQKKIENLNTDSLASLLNSETVKNKGGAIVKQLLNSAFDEDGDGQIIDDLAGKLMKSIFKNS